MPIYLITDNQTGKKYEFTGDREPTQDQLVQLIAPPQDNQQLIDTVNVLSRDMGQVNSTPTQSGLGKSDAPQAERENAIINQQKKLNEASVARPTNLPSNQLR